MNQTLILFPMLTLVGITMTILAMVGFKRLTSRLNPREFALGESAAVPPPVSLPNRNFMNLLEVPVLFYVVCLTYYVTARADTVALSVAWAFVAARACHSLVHLTYNNVYHRLGVYAASGVVLALLWVRFAAALFRGG